MAYYGFGRKDVSPLESLVGQFGQDIDVASDCSEILTNAYNLVSDTSVPARGTAVQQPMPAEEPCAVLRSLTAIQQTLKPKTHHLSEAMSWMQHAAHTAYAAAKKGIQRAKTAQVSISNQIQRNAAAAQVYWTIALSSSASNTGAASSRAEESVNKALAYASAYTSVISETISEALTRPIHAMRNYFSQPAAVHFRPIRQPVIAIPAFPDLSYIRNAMYLGLATALTVGILMNPSILKTSSYIHVPARQASYYAPAPAQQHTAALAEKNRPVTVASLPPVRQDLPSYTAPHTTPNTFHYPRKPGIEIDHMVKACWSELTGLPARGGNFDRFLEKVEHRYMTVTPKTVTITLPQDFHVKAAAVNVYPRLEQLIDSPYIRITSTYNDLRPRESGWRIHRAWDIAAHYGAVIRAPGDGIIRPGPNRGEFFVDHGDGQVTGYAHVLPHSFTPGRYVHTGDNIARVGSTGAYMPHLHFTYLVNGSHTDPLKFFGAHDQSRVRIAQTVQTRGPTKL